MTTATTARRRLQDGNDRFRAGTPQAQRTPATSAPQRPFAAVLACADSRVPPELVFDAEPGDIFVVRVAGNIATPTQIASLEFAAAVLGVRLVVVLGHSHCGAVQTALGTIRGEPPPESPHLAALLDHLRPALETVATREPAGGDDAALARAAVRANVLAEVTRLERDSSALRSLLQHDGLQIVGADYDLDSAAVTFLTG